MIIKSKVFLIYYDCYLSLVTKFATNYNISIALSKFIIFFSYRPYPIKDDVAIFTSIFLDISSYSFEDFISINIFFKPLSA